MSSISLPGDTCQHVLLHTLLTTLEHFGLLQTFSQLFHCFQFLLQESASLPVIMCLMFSQARIHRMIVLRPSLHHSIPGSSCVCHSVFQLIEGLISSSHVQVQSCLISGHSQQASHFFNLRRMACMRDSRHLVFTVTDSIFTEDMSKERDSLVTFLLVFRDVVLSQSLKHFPRVAQPTGYT